MDIAILGSLVTFLFLVEVSKVLIKIYSPSKSAQTGVRWGDPSFVNVETKAKFRALNSLSISFLSSVLVPSILIYSSIFLSSIVLADEVDDDSEDETTLATTINRCYV